MRNAAVLMITLNAASLLGGLPKPVSSHPIIIRIYGPANDCLGGIAGSPAVGADVGKWAIASGWMPREGR
jgi:hypothetical protein